MNPKRFDAVSRHFASHRIARRRTQTQRAAAQAATPDTMPVVDASRFVDRPPAQLFVQAFQSGSIAPSTTEFGTHTVTLARGMGQTVVFTDRPSRDVFTAPTSTFLDGFDFSPDNPPNAAMLMDAGDGTTDIAVVELFNPTYDQETHTATYDIAVLASWQNDLELGFQEVPIDLKDVAPDFGTTHLFIDGCPDLAMVCTRDGKAIGMITGLFRVVDWGEGNCQLLAPPDIPHYGRVGYCNLQLEQCATKCDGFYFLDQT